MLPSIIALGLVALVAIRITMRRESGPTEALARKKASSALALMTLVQSIHFAEELRTGFHSVFGPVFDQPPMPISVFVAFNVACIILWIVSIPALRSGALFAFAAAWFLGLAGVLNGVAHPLLAIQTNGYFPGLVTSSLLFIAGIFLISRLRRASVPKSNS